MLDVIKKEACYRLRCCYLPAVPQVQVGPQRQILQKQPVWLLSFLIAVFMIFVFDVIV
jgi:hypothetical protein